MRRTLVCMASVLGVLTQPAAAQSAGCPDGSARLHRPAPVGHDLATARGVRMAASRRSRSVPHLGYGGVVLSSGYGGTGLGISAPGGFNGPYPYGPAGGLAVYSPGAFGPGPRIITIPQGYGK